MLKFILNKETEETVVYEYFPENGNDSGLVSYDKKADKCSIVTLSIADKHQRYAQKMFSKIREFASNNSFQKEGIIAWY